MAKYLGNAPKEAITFNGKATSPDGSISIVPADIGAAEVVHTHEIADIVSLQSTLNNKADINHTHDYVSALTIAGNAVTGQAAIVGNGDISVSAVNNEITITANAPSITVSDAITNSSDGTTQIKTFMGTQAEWDAFTKEAGVRYVAYII